MRQAERLSSVPSSDGFTPPERRPESHACPNLAPLPPPQRALWMNSLGVGRKPSEANSSLSLQGEPFRNCLFLSLTYHIFQDPLKRKKKPTQKTFPASPLELSLRMGLFKRFIPCAYPKGKEVPYNRKNDATAIKIIQKQ